MRLHEYEAADIFESYGIPVPERCLVCTTGEIAGAVRDVGPPVVIKAQVLVGGRGLAGGVAVAESETEAAEIADRLLGSTVRGLKVETLLIEKKADIDRELYIGITIDGYRGCPVAIAAGRGGVSIEELSKKEPESIQKRSLDPGTPLHPHEARGMFKQLGLEGEAMLAASDAFVRLSRIFVEREALIAEINPLVLCADGTVTAVDAVLEIDDSALKRQQAHLNLSDRGRIPNELERLGREIGVTYVDLDGDIGLISSGAGLGMATMDILARHLKPANFLETGGGITEQLMYDTMGLMMRKKGLRAVLINIYGGINPIHEGAKGVARFIKEHGLTIPVVAKALGNRQEETWAILREAGVEIVTSVATEDAVAHLSELLESGGEK